MNLSCISRVKRTSDNDFKRPENYPLFVFASFTGDRSGSMSSMINLENNAPASGLYDFITEQCKNALLNKQEAFITVTTFDDKTDIVINNQNSRSINVSYKDCVRWMKPRCSTKLYDTAISSLSKLNKDSEELFESLPQKVKSLNPKIVKIWALLTDGQDNASFANSKDLNTTVTKARKNGTICYFLAANQDACTVGQSYGFSVDNSLTFDSTPQFAPQAMRAVTENMLRTASNGISVPFSQIQREVSQNTTHIASAPVMRSRTSSLVRNYRATNLRQPAFN